MTKNASIKNIFVLFFCSVVGAHAANVHDNKAAVDVICNPRRRFLRFKKIVTDRGYRGELIENRRGTFGWVLKIVLIDYRTDCAGDDALMEQRRKLIDIEVKYVSVFCVIKKILLLLPTLTFAR